jgi:formate dehydrogenase accessory protein FdhD
VDGKILASCEDGSRSSSVDKTVGAALLAEVDLSRCILITSSRLSGAIVAKAARADFPVLVSRSAPMNSGVSWREDRDDAGGFCRESEAVCVCRGGKGNLIFILFEYPAALLRGAPPQFDFPLPT